MSHPVDVEVGARIRDRRRLMGVTQKKLADAVGTKFQQIQKYETGANRVSASRLWEISRALKVPMSFFFDGIDETPSENGEIENGGIARASISRETGKVIRMFNSLSRENKKNVINLLRGMSRLTSEAEEDDD